jgi:hypothetical protein
VATVLKKNAEPLEARIKSLQAECESYLEAYTRDTALPGLPVAVLLAQRMSRAGGNVFVAVLQAIAEKRKNIEILERGLASESARQPSA